MAQNYSSNQGRSQDPQRPYTPGLNITAFAVRGFSQLCDMQMAATRLMLQTQARAATSLGLPDVSELFRVADDRAKQLFTSGTEQLLNTAQHARETFGEVQRQVGRLVETQTVSMADTWQRGIEELGAQAEQGLENLSETTRRQAEEAERALQKMAESAQDQIGQAGAAAQQEGDEAEAQGEEAQDGEEGAGENGRSRGRGRSQAGGRGARAR
jgi:hypothetical protein